MSETRKARGYEDYQTPSEDLWEQWAIDVDADPFSLPLEQVSPGHPDLFQARKVLPYFERLRMEDPIHYTDESIFGPYWSVTKFKDIIEIEKDHQTFSSDIARGGIQLGGVQFEVPDPNYSLPMFIMMDPPKHDQQRSVVQPKFTQRGIRDMEPLIRERAATILDALPLNEEFNWVTEVSVELTGQMLATLFDIPQEDRHQLIHWSDTVGNAANTEFYSSLDEAFKELWKCYEYFAAVWDQRKRENHVGTDLISMLVHGESTKNMPPNEFLGNLLLLIVGGNDTTRNSISGGVLYLNENPDEYTKLKSSGDLITSMVSEIIRYQSPIAHMARTATRDVEFKGRQIKEGDRLALWYVSGNRDATEIPNADEFVIDRPNARHHLAFGFGIHRCVGNRLGEMQLRVIWEEIMKRFKHIEVVGDPVYLRSCFINGIRELPVRIHA